jgi:hypothetical protein
LALLGYQQPGRTIEVAWNGAKANRTVTDRVLLGLRFVLRQASVGATHAATARRPLLNPAEKTESAEAGGASTVAAAIKALRQVPGVQTIQLHSPHASIGEPSPHGALGIDGGAPAPAPALELPPLELPPPEPPLDAELPVAPPVVVLGEAPMSLQYVGS